MVRKVAKVTDHSLPYLMSLAYGIPLEELAEGVGADVLPFDTNIVSRRARRHIANQYGMLARLPPDDDEPEGNAEPPPAP